VVCTQLTRKTYLFHHGEASKVFFGVCKGYQFSRNGDFRGCENMECWDDEEMGVLNGFLKVSRASECVRGRSVEVCLLLFLQRVVKKCLPHGKGYFDVFELCYFCSLVRGA
jgi:hypothetical protein